MSSLEPRYLALSTGTCLRRFSVGSSLFIPDRLSDCSAISSAPTGRACQISGLGGDHRYCSHHAATTNTHMNEKTQKDQRQRKPIEKIFSLGWLGAHHHHRKTGCTNKQCGDGLADRTATPADITQEKTRTSAMKSLGTNVSTDRQGVLKLSNITSITNQE